MINSLQWLKHPPTLTHTATESNCDWASVYFLNMAAMNQAADNANAPLFSQVQFYIVQSKELTTDAERDVVVPFSLSQHTC